MPRNSSGTYTEPSGTRAVSGAVASSSAFNELIDDLGDELTASLTANGDKVWTGDQDANGHTITDLQTPVAATDAATKGYVDGASGLSAKLAAIDAQTWSADDLMFFTGSDTVTTVNFFAFGQSLVAAADAAAGRSVLGLGDLAVADTVNDDNWSGTDLAVDHGGTGASSAAGARTNLELNPYTGSDTANVAFPVGSYLFVVTGGSTPSRASAITVTLHANGEQFEIAGAGATVTGTWRCRGHMAGAVLVQRIA